MMAHPMTDAIQTGLRSAEDPFWQLDFMDFVQTQSPEMKKVFEQIRSVAPTRTTVLLIGETGTGKSVLAKLIHFHSSRRGRPFVSIHCGAIQDTLVESELFGHEKGAFTGAMRKKLGKCEIADGGTVFLDEIGTLTPSAQIKLLQVFQDGTFQRVGGEETISVDLRIISATNTDLKQMCDEGGFRKDLYYRLNVFPIEVPPLRNRIEDVPHLTSIILRRLNRSEVKGIHLVDPGFIQALMRYTWPGNIRELENVIERAYISETSEILTADSLPEEILPYPTYPGGTAPTNSSTCLSDVRRRAADAAEKIYIEELLSTHHGRLKTTAEEAGITPRQLHKIMAKHGLKKEDFKTPLKA